MKVDAEKRVRNNLVLEQVAKAENIEVSEAEIDEELKNMAEAYKRSVEEIRGILEGNGSFANLKEEISLRKTIALLLENSKEVEAPAEAAE